MSLIAWWPLNGHTTNQGTWGRELNVTASNVTYNTSGKLGKAMHTGVLTLSDVQWESLIGNTISIAMWVYTRSDGSFSAGVPFFGNSGMTAPNNRKFSMFHYPNKTTLHCSWQNDDSDGTYWGCTYSNFFVEDTWVHLCIVQDASTNTITVYRNGELYSTSSVSGLDSMNITQAASAPIRANINYQHTNDIRIYDHALSTAEVKEISKALVVHYTFDDVLAESTTNLLPYSLHSMVVNTSTNTGSPATYTVTSGLTQGAYYTLSSYITRSSSDTSTNPRLTLILVYSDGTSTQINQYYNTEGTNFPKDDKEYYYVATAKADSSKTLTKVWGWLLDHSSGSGKIMSYRNAQLEAKDHATPYVNGTREGILVNAAGYGGNGTLYNSNLSTDTASGIWSCHTPRINPNNINDMVGATNAAYVYADVFGYNHTPTEFTVAWWWKVMDWGYGTGPFGLVTSNGSYMDSTLGVHDSAVFVNFAGGDTRVSKGFTGGGIGEWMHFALTFKPGSYTSYINGVSQGTSTTNASLTLDPWRYVYLGAGCAGGVLRDGDIYWGEFRYYNTCLSATDIKQLYNVRWAANKQGQVFSNAINEGQEKFQITRSGVVNCNTTYELGNIPNGYLALDGIKMERVPWINTGVVINNAHIQIIVAADVTPTATSNNNCLAGCGNSSWVGPVMLNFCNGKLEFGTNGYSTSSEAQGAYVANERLVVHAIINYNSQQWFKNGIQIKNITSRTCPTTTAPLYIGTFKTPGSSVGDSNSFRGYIHYFEVKYGSIHKKFIPCKRLADSVLGMYEINEGIFYSPEGGTYTVGKSTMSLERDGSLHCNEFNEI